MARIPSPASRSIALLVGFGALCSSLAFPTTLEAQGPPRDSVLSLSVIDVIVRREFGLVGGASAISFSPRSMNLPPIASAEDALRDIPLVSIRQNSRGQAEVSIRGSESRMVAVSVDGVPLTLAWDARTDPSLIPILGAERIEVIRGLSSVLTGPNVLGGMIDISLGRSTGTTNPRPSAHWAMGFDAEGAYSLGGSVTQPIGGEQGSWMFRAGGGFRSRPGVALPDEVEDPASPDGLRTNSFLDQYNAFGALRYRAPSGRWASLSASGYSSDRGVPPELHVIEPRLWQYPEERGGFVSASGGVGDFATPWGSAEAELNLGLQGGSQEIESFTTAEYTAVDDTESGADRTLSARLKVDHTLVEGGSLSTAFTLAQIDHEETAGTDAPNDYAQRLWSIAAATDWTLGAATRLSVGGALDGATTLEAGGRDPLGAKWAPAGRVGVTLPITGRPVALHASASTRARFPALRELYSGSLGRFEPNPDLEPERLRAIEFGSTFSGERLDIQAVAFHNRLTDAVVRITTPEGQFRRVNQNEQETTGIEFLAGFQAGRFEMDGDVTYQNAKLSGPEGGTRPEHLPRFRGGFDIEIPLFVDYMVRGRMEYRGDMYCVHPDLGTDVTLEGAGRADVSVERTFAFRPEGRLRTIRTRASLDNFLDGALYDQCGMPQPGRTLSFGIELY